MKQVSVSVLLFCFLLISAGSAHAYLDPGTGSMVLQLLLGGVAGLVIVLKLYWHRILSCIGLRKEK